MNRLAIGGRSEGITCCISPWRFGDFDVGRLALVESTRDPKLLQLGSNGVVVDTEVLDDRPVLVGE